MTTAARQARRAGDRARVALRERLEARREEIEAAALTRVRAISDPAEVSDPAYAEGLRAAVVAAVAYGIETTGREGTDPPIPVALLAQARMAARVGIPLDTVLRRYFAGYSLLGYFILEEATNAGILDGEELKRLLGAHAGIFDRLLAAISEEYAREAEALRASKERRHAERIERLLAGEPVETAEIPYDFEGWHVGVAAKGAGAERRMRELAASRDCRLLFLAREEEQVWAWLGARRPLDPADLLGALGGGQGAAAGGALAFALGEPGKGIAGWRLTHRQAVAALSVAWRGSEPVVRYADVALLAAALGDELLATSLHQIYLEPLANDGNDGELLLKTLRAYFSAQRNGASAAMALGVSRQTVKNRIQAVEERIGRPLWAVATSIELALRLP